jgi:hypothetical protein
MQHYNFLLFVMGAKAYSCILSTIISRQWYQLLFYINMNQVSWMILLWEHLRVNLIWSLIFEKKIIIVLFHIWTMEQLWTAECKNNAINTFREGRTVFMRQVLQNTTCMSASQSNAMKSCGQVAKLWSPLTNKMTWQQEFCGHIYPLAWTV